MSEVGWLRVKVVCYRLRLEFESLIQYLKMGWIDLVPLICRLVTLFLGHIMPEFLWILNLIFETCRVCLRCWPNSQLKLSRSLHTFYIYLKASFHLLIDIFSLVCFRSVDLKSSSIFMFPVERAEYCLFWEVHQGCSLVDEWHR